MREIKYLGLIETKIMKKLPRLQIDYKSRNKFYFELTKLLKTRMMSKNLKVQLYRTLIRPMAMYGCEVWTLLKAKQYELLVFEWKILRRIFEPCRGEGSREWIIRSNNELKPGDKYTRGN